MRVEPAGLHGFCLSPEREEVAEDLLVNDEPRDRADQERDAHGARQHVRPLERPPRQIVHGTVERPMEVDEEAAALRDGGDLGSRAVGHEPHELLRVVLVEPVQHQQRMAVEVRQRNGPAPRVGRHLLEVVHAVLHGVLERQHFGAVQLRLRPMLNLEPEDGDRARKKERERQPTENQAEPRVQPIHALREALLHDSVSPRSAAVLMEPKVVPASARRYRSAERYTQPVPTTLFSWRRLRTPK